MATNWSLFDGAKAILSGDNNAIAELGKRFPQTSVAIATMGNNEGAMKILGALPVHVTMRKVESVLKGDVTDTEDEVETSEDEEEAPVKKSGRGRKPKAAKTADDKKAAAKARRDARKAAKKAEAEAEEPDVDEDGEVDYSAMNAVELFKECKKRGIKAAARLKAAEYIKFLKADDERAEEVDEDEDEDDGWDDEDEEEEVAPKKSSKKASAKASKKAADDEDDDWDI